VTPEVAGSSPVNHPTAGHERPAVPIARTHPKEVRLDRATVAKVALLSLAATVPLAATMALVAGQQNVKIESVVRERVGLTFTAHTLEVIRSLRILRKRVEIDRSAAPRERATAELALDGLYDYDAGPGRVLDLTKRLKRLQTDWSSVPIGPTAGPAIDAALDSALGLFYTTEDRSSLSSDSDERTIELIDAYGAQLPTVSQRTDDAQLAFERATRGGVAATDQRLGAAVLVGQARRAYEAAKIDIGNASNGSPVEMGAVEPRLNEIGGFLQAFTDAATRSGGPPASHTLRSTGDGAIAAVDRSQDEIRVVLSRLLLVREARERNTFWLLCLGTLLAFAGIVCLAAAIVHTLQKREQRAKEDAKRLIAENEQRRKLEALAVAETQFRAAFDRSSLGVAILDREGQFVRTNQALTELLGSVDAGRLGATHPDFARLLAGEIESFGIETQFPSASGEMLWFESTLSLVRDDARAPLFAIAMLKDVTERRRIEDRLRFDATHDPLSGLPNRAYFTERVRSTVLSDARPRGMQAVLFVDLDEFKFVNDSLGHAIGDQVIIAAGKRLSEATDRNDLVARFGGDEFAVLLDARRNREEIDSVVARIGNALAQPLYVEEREIFVTASIGVAVTNGTYRSVEDMIRDADTAMYYAKSAGRSRSAVFNETMHDQAVRRLAIGTQVRRGLEREQFTLCYQPVVSLAEERIESFEVLLRWKHPELGEISPGEFVPIAEELGLIVPIGRYVLEGACEQLERWNAGLTGSGRLRLSVNASVREIMQTDYCDFLEAIIARRCLRPGELILEVTESALLTSTKYASGTLERIKAAGVALAIDDFGTGYSALRYLQHFPFDQLKIDRSFIAGAGPGIASEAIVNVILSLAESFGVKVVAEGVETREQADSLKALGCDFGQGFLFGEARGAREATALLRPRLPSAS
jgi:diguanylate cyclase (GGDEF)-like protein/PAS domain S-box-containing protein